MTMDGVFLGLKERLPPSHFALRTSHFALRAWVFATLRPHKTADKSARCFGKLSMTVPSEIR